MASQQRLFDDDPAPDPKREKSPRVEKSYDQLPCWKASVVYQEGAEGVFDYRIPDDLLSLVRPGQRLLVPLGVSNRKVEAWCVGTSFGPPPISAKGKPVRLKPISNVIDKEPLLSPKMLELARWLSKRYFCPLGTVMETILPAGVRRQAGTRPTTVWRVVDNLSEKLAQLETQRENAKRRAPLLTPKQRLALDVLQQSPEPMTLHELARSARTSDVPVRALKEMGLLRAERIRRKSKIFEELQKEVPRTAPLELNADQAAAVARITDYVRTGTFKTILLHGVTGSGKTEVYLQSIAEAVRLGKQAIVLVPEISLTPQTVRRFRQRFDSVAVLHSHLTDIERHVEWRRISEGKAQVVIGARSAVFAPLDRLGLIVIDEEHETSFKQGELPRYHAREAARYRAWQEGIPLLLGSATPSLESWYHAQRGEYDLISMPRRVNNYPLPQVSLLDLRTSGEAGFAHGAIHRKLAMAIEDALDENGQVILFLNRRGYSTRIQCPRCGEVMKCPNCDVPLTHHRTERAAICHYCDYEAPIPRRCPNPDCRGGGDILFSGFGTERLEKELADRFSAPVLRMDMDTMRGRGAHEKALAAFRRGEYKILLGTQMIAKGLDFPNVLLVGVISADTSLYHPDFRASERTFHLITQVAGRTGRGERGGRVIVQTYAPEHPAIVAAARHDFQAFVAGELASRKRVGYPPFTELIRIIVRGEDGGKTESFAAHLADRLNASLAEAKDNAGAPLRFRLMGPAPAVFPKLRGLWRWHIHIRSAFGAAMREAIRRALAQKIDKPDGVEWVIDVDPIDML